MPLMRGFLKENVKDDINAGGDSTVTANPDETRNIYYPKIQNDIFKYLLDANKPPLKYVNIVNSAPGEHKVSVHDAAPVNYYADDNIFGMYYEESAELASSGKKLFYIPLSVANKYKFMYEGIMEAGFAYTKNYCKNIAFGWGMREKYVDENYDKLDYDELNNFIKGYNMSSYAYLSKVQGITYYLASKHKILELYSAYPENHPDFIPKSAVIIYSNDQARCETKLTDDGKIDGDIIAKPAFGSQGKGIKVFRDDPNVIKNTCEHFKDQIDSYKVWVLSRYITNTLTLRMKKVNFRVYSLVVLNGDTSAQDNINDRLKCYVLKVFPSYSAVADYDPTSTDTNVVITNLENVHRWNKNHPDATIDPVTYNKVYSLNGDGHAGSRNINDDRADFNPPEAMDTFKDQAMNIVSDTVSICAPKMKCLNRYSKDYKGCFNFLAYDLMMDDNGKLWLIEINRGPDMMALLNVLGHDSMKSIFKELTELAQGDESNLNNFEKVALTDEYSNKDIFLEAYKAAAVIAVKPALTDDDRNLLQQHIEKIRKLRQSDARTKEVLKHLLNIMQKHNK
jgi:hypothetical protein